MKLSIITVVYNNVTCIEDTILNILDLKDQNPDIENVIIDGGSTDGTCAIIEKYKDKISYFISEPDHGIYDAMNKGIKASRGEWLIFMNSGDLFYQDVKALLKEMFKKNNNFEDYDVIYGNTLTKNSREIISIPLKKIESNFFFFNTICHQSVFFNKSVFNNLGYYNLNYKIISDRDLLFRVANSNGKFYHLDYIVSIWDEEGFSKDNYSLFSKEENLFKTQNFSLIKRNYISFIERLYNLLKKL